MAFIDATGQQIPRPTDNKRRATFYSGKNKRHTIKTQLMVNNQGIIVHKLRYKKGRRHDYDIYKMNYPVIPKDVINVFDLGYLGVEKDFTEKLSSISIRKKKNMELSQEEKEYKSHSRSRIVIEHTTISRLKKYKIMNKVFRNRLRKYNRISDIVAGLINY